MAIIPDNSCLEGAMTSTGPLRVPLFLVRVDGVIYPTSMYMYTLE